MTLSCSPVRSHWDGRLEWKTYEGQTSVRERVENGLGITECQVLARVLELVACDL